MLCLKRLLYVLPFFLFCTHIENPFTDPSNARMVAIQKSTSFKINSSDNSPDTASIFTTETLTVSAEVRELIDSFTISVEKNRFWSTKTILHPTSEDYRFLISFYDTGNQTILITTSRSDGAVPFIQKILLNVKNPLHQNDIPKYNISDSLTLSSGATVDRDGTVWYNWSFDNDGLLIRSQSPTFNTKINSPTNFDTLGYLWVSDSNTESPKVQFSYTFYDSTPPVIICVNDNYNIQNKTIITPDTIFSFKVKVTDRGDQSVDSVTIGGEGATPAFKGRANVYTSVITNVHTHKQENPLKITVSAVDNKLYRNDTTEYFFIIFDEKATHKGSTILKINSITDSTLSTSRNNFNVFGSIENTMDQRIVLNLFLNDIHLKDTLIQGRYGNWNSVLSLKDGANVFYILAKDSNKITVDSQSVMIFYQPNAIDNLPPVILSKEIDGQTVDNEIFFTKNDSVTIQISTFDAGSGVQKIKYDDDSIMVQESNFRPVFVIRDLKHERKVVPVQVIDFKGNTCKDSLFIHKNTSPAYTLTHPLPHVAFIDSTYTDTINFSDNDHDHVFLQILSKPNSMTIDTSSGISGIISWTPRAQDTIGLSFQLHDGLDPTISELYKFAVVNLKDISPKLEISDETSVPLFLEAENDTLLSVVKIKAGTGNQPFLFTADLVNKSKSLLNLSRDSQIVWNPTESDTGIAELRIIVEDSLRFCDTLFRSIPIVPKNKYRSTLSWTTTLDTTGGRLILGGEKDTTYIHFFIHDADDPRTEKHIITQKSRGMVSTMRVDADTFSLKLPPKSNLATDTLQVIINDNTHTSDTISIPLIYSTSPDHFPQLYSWFNDETYIYLKGDLPNKIDDWNSTGTNPFPFDNANGDCDLFVRTTADGHKVVRFNDKNNFLIHVSQGTLFDSSLTVFIVAKFDSIPAGSENMTLISSNELGNYNDNNKTTAFGVSKEGHVAFFSRPSVTGSITNKTSSNIIVAPKVWHVYSFSTTGIANHLIPVDISVDRVHDKLTAAGDSNPGLILGRCYKNATIFPWYGDIAEIIIFNRVLSFDERTSIELYLADKFPQ